MNFSQYRRISGASWIIPGLIAVSPEIYIVSAANLISMLFFKICFGQRHWICWIEIKFFYPRPSFLPSFSGTHNYSMTTANNFVGNWHFNFSITCLELQPNSMLYLNWCNMVTLQVSVLLNHLIMFFYFLIIKFPFVCYMFFWKNSFFFFLGSL